MKYINDKRNFFIVGVIIILNIFQGNVFALNFNNNNSDDFFYMKLERDLENMSLQLQKKLTTMHKDLSEFNIVDRFGVNNNGREITTSQIQHAIDTCSQIGGGVLFFPKGMYLTGTIILRSNVHLKFTEGAQIIGSANPDDYEVIYPAYKNNTDRQVNKALFYAEKIENISFTGKGVINFRGDDAIYLNSGNNDPRRPFGIRIVSSKNIYVSDLMLINSPQWMQHYLDCENLMIENVNVFNHAQRNNDGMDIDGCRNVYVRNCYIDSDDDAICLKSNGVAPCENVLIEDCTASSHCNALKLGTETTGGFINVIYRNCKVMPSITGRHHVNGVSTTRTAITLIITDGGTMQNVWFDKIEAIDCITPIYVTLGNRSRKHTDSAPKPAIGRIENIRISNFNAIGAGPITSSLTGLNSSYKIKNVYLNNVHIHLDVEGEKVDRSNDFEALFIQKKSKYPSSHVWDYLPSAGLYFKYIDGLQMDNVIIDNDCNDNRELIINEEE
nr:glycosyl hydrolase family 28 protein [uncultured Carboxylicivirga sp.]